MVVELSISRIAAMAFCKMRWRSVFQLLLVLLGIAVGQSTGSISPEIACVFPGNVATFTCCGDQLDGDFTWIINTTNTTITCCQPQCGPFSIHLQQGNSILTFTDQDSATVDFFTVECHYNGDLVGNATLIIADACPATTPTTSPGTTPTSNPSMGPVVSDSGRCTFGECWLYVLVVIPVLVLIAITINCGGVYWILEEENEVVLPDIGVKLSHRPYYADPYEFLRKDNTYSVEPDTSKESNPAGDDNSQTEYRPEDHVPTYADPRTIERQTAPDTGDVYTLVRKQETEVPFLTEESPYEPVEIEKSEVQYSMINTSAKDQLSPEEWNKIQTSTTVV